MSVKRWAFNFVLCFVFSSNDVKCINISLWGPSVFHKFHLCRPLHMFHIPTFSIRLFIWFQLIPFQPCNMWRWYYESLRCSSSQGLFRVVFFLSFFLKWQMEKIHCPSLETTHAAHIPAGSLWEKSHWILIWKACKTCRKCRVHHRCLTLSWRKIIKIHAETQFANTGKKEKTHFGWGLFCIDVICGRPNY